MHVNSMGGGFKVKMNSICQSAVVLIISFAVVAGYTEYFVEEKCTRGDEEIVYKLDANQAESSGILRPVQFYPYSPGKNCTIVLEPPKGHGVTVSVRKIDFVPNWMLKCTDYIKILGSPSVDPHMLCKFKFDRQEEQSFSSNGALKILYHTESRQVAAIREIGFELIFTVFTTDPEECNDQTKFRCTNSKCIWKGLMCDGDNNCGDRSDEISFTCDQLSKFPIIYIVYISIGVVAFVVLVTCCIVCCCVRSAKDDVSVICNDPGLSPPSLTPYQAFHPTGYFISQDPAGPSTLYQPQYPAVLHAEGGFANPCYGVPQTKPPPYQL